MFKTYIYTALIFLCSFSCAYAFKTQAITEKEANEMMGSWKPIEVSGDAITWGVFAKTKEVEECKKDVEGFDNCIIKPEYSEGIKNLDGKEVTLMGFMFPLEQAEKQQNFLIGPYPLSCPFHYHVGPSQMVEVFAKEPIAFSFDPITVKGKLSLKYNEETGVFYYLEYGEER